MQQLRGEDFKNDVAIIAMNCRFPGIQSIEEFWNVLSRGDESVQKNADTDDTAVKNNFIPTNTVMERTEYFDNEFFGISAREAEITDPQHRVFLECAWETLETAGYDPFRYDGLIGLYAGVSTSTYLINNILTNPELVKSVGDLSLMIGNDKDHFSSRIAYKLNLTGPCMTVQTSCSTSLVAAHLACESLLSGQCDMALAGGVSIKYPQVPGYTYYQGGLVSSDGHIRAFDRLASGTVYSDGLGIVLLKRLEDALYDKDMIYAVIKGSAVTSDGAARVGYTAPGVDGQIAALLEAKAVAGIDFENISYIEAHGSGTPLGDGIEIEALIQAFRTETEKTSFCALGSVKTNIGHTEMASGVAGLIKTALSLKHKIIPASLNCSAPQESLGFDETPFYVNTMTADWHSENGARIAGVSSFGLGGINAHMMLQEPPEIKREEQNRIISTSESLLLSAKSAEDLLRYLRVYKRFLKDNPTVNLNDLAKTLKNGRRNLKYRVALHFDNYHGLMAQLDELCDKPAHTFHAAENRTDHSSFNGSRNASLTELGELWASGYDIPWHEYGPACDYHKISLPTYPWNHKKLFVPSKSGELPVIEDNPATGTYEDVYYRIKRIWQEKLGCADPSEHDNFFQLGGNSFLITQVSFELNKQFKIDLPLAELYEHPTLPDLTEAVTDALLNRGDGFKGLPKIVPDPAGRNLPFPLTDIQKAYWIGRNSAMALGNISTHMYFESDIRMLDPVLFQQAFNRMINRHEMLRVVILAEGAQQVLPQVPLYEIPFRDVSAVSQDEQKRYIRSIRDEMSHQMFDCTKWPLFDVRATKMTGNTVKLHVSIDLLIADAWSLELLLSELAIAYHDRNTRFEPLDLSFRDYVLAINQIEQSDYFEESKAYWQKRIETLPAGPKLPIQVDPSAVANPHFVRRRYISAPDRWRSINKKAAERRLSPTIVLLTAFSDVLGLWSKTGQFTLNMTVFNRLPLHSQVNMIMGDFTTINLLEVHNDISVTLAQRMQQNQTRLFQDMDHRFYSGIKVTRDLISMRKNDASGAIMPVIFTSLLNQDTGVWAGATEEFSENSGLDDDNYSISQTPQVWLDQQVMERNGTLVVNWDSVDELFPERMIDEMFDDYCRLLEQLADEDWPWDSNSPLTSYTYEFPHQRRLNIAVQQQPISDGAPLLLHGGFARQCEKAPQRPAVITANITVSYKQLDLLSNAFARIITASPRNDAELVAVVMSKGWEQVAAVLGILKAGRAYLPIDSTLPKERIRKLLEIGGVSICLTQEAANTVCQEAGCRTITVSQQLLDKNGAENDFNMKVAQAEAANPDDLAYVIFTSGSTGTPKGVMISHRGAVNTILDINRRFCVGPEDRVLALSSLGFDLSVYDIFGLLGAGGAIVFPEADKLRDPVHWTQLMSEYRISIWNTVPAFMRMLIQYEHASLGALRLVLLSGDWIPKDLPTKITAVAGDVRVVSLGGATEASIWSIIHPIDNVDDQLKSIPYGKAMSNQSMYVLNSELQLCPIDAPGEIYIGGGGLAIGYWRDEEKTNHRFITHPLTGERLYQTGDGGRYLNDGNIEFLGRLDNQVKINGHRIELGEIENVMKSSQYVNEAVVVLGGEGDNKGLIAFVEVDAKGALSVPDLDEDIILDPAERIRFKISEPAIRREIGKGRITLQKSSGVTEFYKRRSYRNFSSQSIPLHSFSALLQSLAQQRIEGVPFPKYLYASGGGIYPVQCYLYVKRDRIEDVPGGFYYYDPKAHELMLLSDSACDETIHEKGNQAIFNESAFSVFLVGRLDVISRMYGKKGGLDFMKIEAGLISQLLEMKGADHNIGLCQIGTLNFGAIKDKLGCDMDDRIYLNCLLGGHIDANMTGLAGFSEDWKRFELSMDQDTVQSKTDIKKELLTYLKDNLPEYMIPQHIHLLSKLPLTGNGKIDRKTLMQDNAGKMEIRKRDIVLPETTAERIISSIWAECFPGQNFSIRDNFFDLGGDSVMVVAVFNKIQKEFEKTMNLVDLFSYPTIESLSKFLSADEIQPDTALDEERKRAAKRKQAMQRKKQGKGGDA